MRIAITAALSLMLLGIGLLPAKAQNVRMLPGKVESADRKTAQLSLYLRAGKDAPGKPPVEMAQQAATLLAQAEQLARQGKAEAAARIRTHVDELLCWRELTYTVPDWSRLELSGLRKMPLDNIETGIRVRLVATAAGRLRPRDVPAQVTLASDIEQRTDRAPARVRQLPDVPGTRGQFLEVVGEVINLDPLKLSVNGATVTVALDPQYRFVGRVAVAPREVQPGHRILAAAAVTPGLQVKDIRMVVVLFDRTDNPIELSGMAD